LGEQPQVNEIQSISCQASSGTFTLSYKKKTTAPIPFDTATSSELTSYLEALPTIGFGGVSVQMGSSSVCEPGAGGVFEVTFLKDFGTLPSLVPDATNLGGGANVYLAVSVLVQGSKENAQCSNRGICDTNSGVCACSTNFYTSDGYGGPGQRDG
jgi:hypothetical protein